MPAFQSHARATPVDRPGSLDRYFRDIAAFPLLSMAEKRALAARIRRGDQDARDALVRANLRFVVAVARRYAHYGVPLADLINEGNLGLLRGAARFDGAQGARFVSYAVWWVRQAILQLLAEQGRPVRVPPRAAETMWRIGRRATALRRTLGRDATLAELAAAAAVRESEVVTAIGVRRRPLSLDAPVAPGAGRSLRDQLADAWSPAPDERVMEAGRVEAVRASVAALPARQALVVRRYFGLDGDDAMTLEEIGAELGVTRERVRQIKAAALATLRVGRRGTVLATLY